jgi:hypothetical protein
MLIDSETNRWGSGRSAILHRSVMYSDAKRVIRGLA